MKNLKLPFAVNIRWKTSPKKSQWVPRDPKIPSCLKAWDLAVPKIFVTCLSQWYLSHYQASQGFKCPWDFCPWYQNSIIFQSYCPTLRGKSNQVDVHIPQSFSRILLLLYRLYSILFFCFLFIEKLSILWKHLANCCS